VIYLDGGDDPNFTQIDAYLRAHFNARAVYLDSPDNPDTAPHPGEPHTFITHCTSCGLPGYLHVSLITQDEQVSINPIPRKD
jgi:hypothetical protein